MRPEDIEVVLAGARLSNPTMLSSGVQGSSLSRVVEAMRVGAGGAVTKSIGQEPREGYREPTMVEVDGGYVNAVGLPNPGAKEFARELEEVKGKGLPIFVSVFGGDESEFAGVVKTLDGGDFLAYELNLSCPHVKGVGTEVGHDPELVGRVVREVRRSTKKPVFAKVSPNTERLLEVARAAVDAGADGLTAINTVRALQVDLETGTHALSNGYGGLSGKAIRTVALRCVYELAAEFEVPVIGCGGVSGWEDAVRLVLAGASAVQVGSATLQKFDLFNDINLGIIGYMERKGFSGLSDMVGSAHRRGS